MRVKLIVAFGIVYLVWGSTYFAIRVGLESLAPFTLGAVRFLLAGSVLYLWTRLRGATPATAAQWRAAALSGILMLFVANGAVIWAEQRAPSGLVALMVTTVPLWMVLLDWWRRDGVRPDAVVFGGLAIGSLGIVLLVNPTAELRGVGVPPVEAVVLLIGTLAWALGSLASRNRRTVGAAPLMASLQMLVAGTLFALVAAARGEPAALDPASLTPRSLVAVAYLAVFGSIVAFSAYIWLTGATSPTRLGTYAYVNPVVALFLGAAWGGEAITPRVLFAAALVLAAVVAITAGRGPARRVLGSLPRRRHPRLDRAA